MSDHYEYPYPSTELESRYPFYPYEHQRLPEEIMKQRASLFFEEMNQRRSIRMFSSDTVPTRLIELAVRTASTAPSGAHKQPWTFIATQNSEIKRAIREAAEEEERKNYLENRMNADWQEAIAPLGTDYHKEFLEIAPWLVVLFEQRYEIASDGSHRKNYYVKESVGIAAGLFIASLHRMGLATLTHTPSPMKFLNQILERPVNERPFCLFPIGYPLDGIKVPDLQRKELDEILHVF
ncbi:MAG: nitroreductase family protein [Acidimicrobiaceae bacterium]|jgi:nitroreductase|nr:nitroreductase family protein [Acidimicrobiaceae bacterium]|tara:strand:+ start:4426 stop:5136 length:711 start_codon:yes stop_codon:yes gene_type:complete